MLKLSDCTVKAADLDLERQTETRVSAWVQRLWPEQGGAGRGGANIRGHNEFQDPTTSEMSVYHQRLLGLCSFLFSERALVSWETLLFECRWWNERGCFLD